MTQNLGGILIGFNTKEFINKGESLWTAGKTL